MSSVEYTERQRIEKEWHDAKFRDRAVHDERAVDRASKRFWETVGQPSDLTILDFGCGEGWLSVKLAKQGNTLHGFDLSESLIARARQLADESRVAGQTTFRQMAAENLDYPDASFDMVIGTSILHHTELDITLQRMRRVLKPNGRAIFLEPLNQNIALRLWRLMTPWRRTRTERAFTGEDVAAVTRYFPATRFTYYCFLSMFAVTDYCVLSMFAVPLLMVAPKNPTVKALNGWLEDLDERLLAAFPSLGRFSAVTVMDMRK
jgi:2-polyprenyl-3-methyl-5-hydroxy-6-metoxy-1,4-benzoquinol methylase